jgi:hypothetical protein
MKRQLPRDQFQSDERSSSLNRKLAAYMAASASIGAVMASEAKAIVVSNTNVQNIGINGFANIDFNSDGQTDVQIDHDRVDLTAQGGPVVDYLQFDKNDVNGASPGENLFATDFTKSFPTNGTVANNTANTSYLVQNTPSRNSIEYPTAMLAGGEIGSNENFDFQEGENVWGNGTDPPLTGRFNRLIDEDHGQTDVALNGKTQSQLIAANNIPQFTGVQNQVRYLGVKMELNSTKQFNYGWIGIKITNEADATGQVVGYGYESEPNTAILAGQTGITAGDYNNDGKVDMRDYVLWRNGGPLQNETFTPGTNTIEDYTAWRVNFNSGVASGSGAALGSGAAVPEPGSLLLSLVTSVGLIAAYFCRRIRGR